MTDEEGDEEITEAVDGDEAPDAPDEDVPEVTTDELPEVESEPAPSSPFIPGSKRIEVDVDEDGNGTTQIGYDPDSIALYSPPTDCSVELAPHHTVGITLVRVKGAKPLSTVQLTVLPK